MKTLSAIERLESVIEDFLSDKTNKETFVSTYPSIFDDIRGDIDELQDEIDELKGKNESLIGEVKDIADAKDESDHELASFENSIKATTLQEEDKLEIVKRLYENMTIPQFEILENEAKKMNMLYQTFSPYHL